MTFERRAINRVARRIFTLLDRARIKLVNDGGAVQKLQVQVNALETISELQRLAEFGFTSSPPADSDVAIVFLAGDRANGIAIATGHQRSRPTGLQAGETMLYSLDGKQIYLTAGGGIKVNANGQTVEIDNATTVTINAATRIRAVTPVFECTGDIVDNCDTQSSTLAELRAAHDEHDHDVENVQPGSSTITTSTPNKTV
ncbi:baseplate assembly protein [Burkholderia sp. WAC0059]|nr:baseplate assembly protein [Burkholderia sp. WAC0059]